MSNVYRKSLNKYLDLKKHEIQLAENLGMVLRTMLNFGFKNLRLVNPKVNLPNKKTISSSAGAYDIIGKNIKIVKHVFLAF